MGTYLETLSMGAEVIVTSGGVGPCRAGLYCSVHEEILRDLGYDFKMIVFEPPRLHPINFIRNVKFLNQSRLSIRGIVDAIKRGWRKVQALDNLEKMSHHIRPREVKRGDTTRVYRKTLQWVDAAYSHKEIEEAEAEGLKAIQTVEQDNKRDIIKVGIVGEIYVLLEPASNLEVEELLGNLGVEVFRSMFLTGWTKDNTWNKTDHFLTLAEIAAPYLPELIGGHGRDSIANTIIYANNGFDGVIQLAPFTCIPEIVARTILPKVSKDYDIPVLT
ncbi:MAG TPA: CoA protein activase, partial [Clostridia bacterium]|nr:CoA protein activase [Clostridia bacterium]